MVGLKEGLKPSFLYAARYYLRNTKSIFQYIRCYCL
nr:MAG TPA: hypothetical protein [Caudoviricetes sp.]